MILESADRIAAYLEHHRNFGECLLEEVRWQHYGTDLDLVFNYIWQDDGTVRADIECRQLKILTFRTVQEYHMWNALNEHMVLQPDEMNWGMNEVAGVTLVDDEQVLDKYRSLPIPFHHVRCSWEGGRRIDIVFAALEVS